MNVSFVQDDYGIVFIQIDKLPPTANQMYTVVGGRKILSPEARKYKNRLKTSLAKEMLDYRPFSKDDALRLYIDICMPNMLNKGFPKKAKTKFRKIDVSNRVKLIEDTICEVLTIDDSQIVSLGVTKWHEESYIYLKLEKIPVRSFGPTARAKY